MRIVLKLGWNSFLGVKDQFALKFGCDSSLEVKDQFALSNAGCPEVRLWFLTATKGPVCCF